MSSNTDSSMKLKDSFFFGFQQRYFHRKKLVERRKKDFRYHRKCSWDCKFKNLIVGIMRNRQVLLFKQESSETMTLNYACKAEL